MFRTTTAIEATDGGARSTLSTTDYDQPDDTVDVTKKGPLDAVPLFGTCEEQAPAPRNCRPKPLSAGRWSGRRVARHTRPMADIEIDDSTRAALQALADDAGLSLEAYLARVAEEKQRERALAAGAEAFRRVTGDPATVAAFDSAFGGPARHTPRAA